MLRASVDTIARITGGTVLIGDETAVASDLSVDSRECAPGCVFVALAGERSDGHDHLLDAIASGARVLLVNRSSEELAPVIVEAQRTHTAVIRVEDGLRAVQDISAWHRSRLHCPVVGITGSTGKTTTKDFIDAVLSTSMRVVSTTGNRNNELGVPLTLLRAGSDTDCLVVEMGMRGLGQIARLSEVAKPTHGLVTNVGTSHIEILGSQHAVATAKGELVRAVPADGCVFLNGDDGFSEAIALDSKAPVTLYGLDERCAVRAENIVVADDSTAAFDLVTPAGTVPVALPLPGRHNVYNALAAAAVGLSLAVTLDKIAEGLAAAKVTAMRMETFTAASGVTVVNDAYNANPSSMRSAVETLSEMRVPGRRIAVLGDMAELGSLSELAHFQIGELVARVEIDELVTVGERARRIADGAVAEGMDRLVVRPCAGADEASEVLDDLLEPGDVVLVKASRVMGLERVVEGIVNPRVG